MLEADRDNLDPAQALAAAAEFEKEAQNMELDPAKLIAEDEYMLNDEQKHVLNQSRRSRENALTSSYMSNVAEKFGGEAAEAMRRTSLARTLQLSSLSSSNARRAEMRGSERKGRELPRLSRTLKSTRSARTVDDIIAEHKARSEALARKGRGGLPRSLTSIDER